MKNTQARNTRLLGKALGVIALLGAWSLANAASVTGSMGFYGAYSFGNGTDLGNTTSLNLVDVFGSNGGDGDLGNVNFFSLGTANSAFDFSPSVAIVDLLTIEGWQLDISTSAVVNQDTNNLNLTGTGVVSCVDSVVCGTGFDPTTVVWDFSAQATGNSYSMSVTAVPVPAALWLFGSGLIALGGAVRKRRS